MDYWKLAAGLSIFLYGMFLLEDSVRVLSGRAFRRMIRLYTDGRLRSIGSGALVTAILQSSSAVSLMVLAFVGAGVMTMENGIGVMMGANIGTTFTSWIVAVFGFKIKIESFAFPLIACAGLISMLVNPSSKGFQIGRLLIGFGFLFLGLDFMKSSVEAYAEQVNLEVLAGYGAWVYMLFGIVMTALMQSSSASIAVILTGINSSLIGFDIAVAMVIGANIGTTVTVLLGSLGGSTSKKRVAASHLVFNLITGIVAFAALQPLAQIVTLFFDTSENAVMALALFHTQFNILGVIIFFPFIGLLARFLLRFFPERKEVLTVYLNNDPTEVPEEGAEALRKEILHLLEECQLYALRTFGIDDKLVFDRLLPFEKNFGSCALPDFYDRVKLLHGEIVEFYAKLLQVNLEKDETKDLERIIYASRNVMNSVKNIKGIRHNISEFDNSDNERLNQQYRFFRRRLIGLHHRINSFLILKDQEKQHQSLLKMAMQIEDEDKQFVSTVMKLAAEKNINELEISSLLMANRLFSQSCRLQIFALKDLLLKEKEISDFDRAMDAKETPQEKQGE
jgi:phosphate:Na+ symporter